jgi:hypothetical protein
MFVVVYGGWCKVAGVLQWPLGKNKIKLCEFQRHSDDIGSYSFSAALQLGFGVSSMFYEFR